MGLVQKPFTHNPSNNNTTPAESAKVNANDDVIYAVVNGDLSDPNINPSANIQQSKIANLPQSLTTLTNGIATINNALNSTLNSVAVDVGEPGAAAVGEQQLYVPIVVAANSLGSDNYLFLSQDFLLYMVDNSNFQLRYYFGGGVFFTPLIANSTGITQTNINLHVDITLRARASTQAQYALGRAFMQSTNSLLFMGAHGINQVLTSTGLVTDTTVDLALQTNAYWDTPGNQVFGIGSACWMVK